MIGAKAFFVVTAGILPEEVDAESARDPYMQAMRKALDGGDPWDLVAMLEAGIPCPPDLLPVLADVIRWAQEESN